MKRSFLILASVLLSLLAAPLPPAQAQGRPEPLPRVDRRLDWLPPVRLDADRAAALAALEAKLPSIVVDFHPITGAPLSVRNRFGFLSGPAVADDTGALAPGATNNVPPVVAPADAEPSDSLAPVNSFLDRNAALFGHGAVALARARITRDYVTAHNGLRTVVWQQELDGIPIFDAVLSAHVTQRGELVTLSSGFVPAPATAADAGVPDRRQIQVNPPIPARWAVAEAAAHIGETLAAEEVEPVDLLAEGPQLKQTFKAAVLQGDAQAELVWLAMNRETLRLCWRVVLTGKTRQELFQALIDTQTGDLQVRHCWTSYSDRSYRVYSSDSPSPFSPGHSAPNSNQPMNINTLGPEFISQVNVLDSAVRGSEASPQGWVASSTTVGNNVDAHTDLNGDANVNWGVTPLPYPNPPRPVATDVGGVLQFHFNADLTQAPNQNSPARNQDAAVVNAFYWCNWMHDRLYELGFTEGAGNFQQDNFGRGGLGVDAVLVDVQNGANQGLRYGANISVSGSDGSQTRLSLYLNGGVDGPSPERDDAFDAEIILHEYTHGLTRRLVGAGTGLTSNDYMDECWTDFYALAFLAQPTDDINGAYAFGAYTRYLWAWPGYPLLTQNYHYGMRYYPLSTAMSVNPLTLNDVDNSHLVNPHTEPMNPAFGWRVYFPWYLYANVWNGTLWEARAKLIAKYGFSQGNQLILQLVTDGLRLTPPHPDFIQARDALLQADYVNTLGANQAELWMAFAKRGMGCSAVIEHPNPDTWVPHEAFDLPSSVALAQILLNPNAVLRNDFGGWVGFRFQVGSLPVTVTELGRLVVSGNNGTHAIKLVDASTGLDVPGGSTTVTTAGKPSGLSTYEPLLNPVVLAAGGWYNVMSLESAGGDRWYDHPDCQIWLTSVATPRGACWRHPQTGYYYYDPYQAPQTYVPVNVRYLTGFGWSPAGQVPKGEMSASSSSTYPGWEAGRSIDHYYRDPGWHNTSYANATEFLRIDLGRSRIVNRVGYLPRVMSLTPADGSWNGVYRQFTIYVTDSQSTNPLDWGVPVAGGEWSWPDGQERRDVICNPKAGRFVYLLRETAWGWYTPTWPGYASANEIWVYEQSP